MMLLLFDSPGGLVTSGLQLLYLFDEGSGQDILDSSGKGNDGFLGSDGTVEAEDPSRIGEGIRVNVNDFVHKPTPSAELRSDSFTITALVKWVGNTVTPLCVHFTSPSNMPALFLGAPFNSQRPIMWIGNSIFAYFEKLSPVDLTDSDWHFMCFSAPGRSIGDVPNFKLRADGKNIPQESSSASGAEKVKDGFFIGDRSANALAENLDIAYFSHHNRVLSDSECDQMRDHALGIFNKRPTTLNLDIGDGITVLTDAITVVKAP